ncbi:MAG: hypothetical protein DVB25_08220 [Verrucomicrobia bacterium]|nr:MAG: hypothetical protein DVB25_08220 [Verrucomicrobiota bacterium]
MLPELIIGSSAFGAALVHAALAAAVPSGKRVTKSLDAAQAAWIDCAQGLTSGCITGFWRSQYQASLAK